MSRLGDWIMDLPSWVFACIQQVGFLVGLLIGFAFCSWMGWM